MRDSWMFSGSERTTLSFPIPYTFWRLVALWFRLSLPRPVHTAYFDTTNIIPNDLVFDGRFLAWRYLPIELLFSAFTQRWIGHERTHNIYHASWALFLSNIFFATTDYYERQELRASISGDQDERSWHKRIVGFWYIWVICFAILPQLDTPFLRVLARMR